MKTVTVRASQSYEIYIGSALLDKVGSYCRMLPQVRRICVVSDSNVFPLYGRKVMTDLKKEGFEASSFVFEAGEAAKNGQTYLELLNTLAQNQLTRTDLILALGGGVVGDLAGFAAATYFRGIRFIQIPTTVLAAVDSSVGGKTAIDLPGGKNLAGAFWQPSMVICDTHVLNTLPEAVFREGCSEIIKYAVLYDPELFELLEKTGISFPRKEVIARCISHKAQVVAADEFDRGERMKLNLGHTIGHAIEKLSHYAVSHGAAVAMGMAIIARGTGCVDAGRITSLLQQFLLPVQCTYEAEALHKAALSDKKRSGNTIDLILPERIGNCRIETTPCENLKSILEAGL